MKLTHVFASILLLTTLSVAQQTTAQDRATDAYNTGARAVESGHNWGGWGLLGLLGLGGLLGRRRDETTTTGYTRDDRTYGQQRRVG